MEDTASTYPPLDYSGSPTVPDHPYFVQSIEVAGSSLPRQDLSSSESSENDTDDDASILKSWVRPLASQADKSSSGSSSSSPDDIPASYGTHSKEPGNCEETIIGARHSRRGRPNAHGRGPSSRGRGTRGRPRGSRPPVRGDASHPSRRGRRGPRPVAEPSHEFKDLQGKATTAFLEARYEDAARFASQAIQINPEIFAAHSLLSEVYWSMGKKEESLGVLWSGAHTHRDVGVWWEVVARINDLAGTERDTTADQLLYCYRQILKLDFDDYDARRSRLDVYRKVGSGNKAMKECERLLKIRPHDLDNLELLAELCTHYGAPERAKKAYAKSVEHYINVQEDEYGGEFSFSDLNIYLEIFLATKDWSLGIHEAKRISRWLCGRRHDIFWDQYQDDDREWDLENEPRRMLVSEFVPGVHPVDAYGYGLPIEIRVKLGLFRLFASTDGAEEALRHVSFLEPRDHRAEAYLHSHTDLFREVGDALFTRGLYTEALEFYEPLLELQEGSDATLLMALAKTYAASDARAKAIAFYQSFLEVQGEDVATIVDLAELSRDGGQSDRAWDLFHAFLNSYESGSVQTTKMRGLPLQDKSELQRPGYSSLTLSGAQASNDIPSRSAPTKLREAKSRPRGSRRTLDDANRANGKVTGTMKESLPVDVKGLYFQLRMLRPGMRRGDFEPTVRWLEKAATMLQDFRSQAIFYPFERYIKFLGYDAESKRRATKASPEKENSGEAQGETSAAAEEQRHTDDQDLGASEHPIPDEYQSVKFKEWLAIFCEYALCLARSQEPDSEHLYDTLSAASDANVFFHDKDARAKIFGASVACAILLNDEEKMCNLARAFIKEHSFATDGFRLFAALSRIYIARGGQPSWYNCGPNQKFLSRQVKVIDEQLLVQKERSLQTAKSSSDKDSISQVITTHDPVLLMLYGHILATAGSYPQALNYYFRAYAAQPGNALTSLSIGLAYMQYAIKRQSENRHYAIVQGIAFIRKYRELRLRNKDPESMGLKEMEVEYNEGRAWHLIGLVHLAIPCYEKCLELCEKLQHDRDHLAANNAMAQAFATSSATSEPDFSVEAAFALQTIFALGGDMGKARKITERWLVF